MKLCHAAVTVLTCVMLFTTVSKASDRDHLSVGSIGRSAKLNFVADLLVPANKSEVLLPDSSRYPNVVSSCRVEMNEASLDTRVLKAGSQVIFTGEAHESVESSWRIYTLKVEQPLAIRSVSCYAQRMDHNYKWHPTAVLVWDLKTAFAEIATLVLPEPVEIPSP